MKIRIISVSHKQPEWVNQAFLDYKKRFPKDWHIEFVEIKPEGRNQNKNIDAILLTEKQKIEQALLPQAVNWPLDEHGELITTVDFAKKIEKLRQESFNLNLIIGSADGLHPDLKNPFKHCLALSKMTLPHGLVRVFLMEQIYRAYTILINHPYHRE